MRRFNVEPVDDAASWILPATRQDMNDQLTTAAKKPVSATAESSSVQKEIKWESSAKKIGSQSPLQRRPDTGNHKQRAQGDEKETPPSQVEALRLKLQAVKQSPHVKASMLRTELKNMAKSVDDTIMRRILEQIMCVFKAKTPHGAKDLAKQHGSEINALAHLMVKNERIKLADVRKMIEAESKQKLKESVHAEEAASVHAEEPTKKRRRKMKSKATDKKTTLEKPVEASKKPDRDHETQPKQRQKVQTNNRAPLTNPQDVRRSRELGARKSMRRILKMCGEVKMCDEVKSIGQKQRTATSQRHGLSGVEFEDEDWAHKEDETDDMRHKIENMRKRVAASAGRRQGKCQTDWGGPIDGHDQDTNYLVDDQDRKPSPEVLKRQMLRDEQLCFDLPPQIKQRRRILWEKQITRTLSTGGQGQTTRDKRSTASTTGNDSTTRKVTTQRQENSTLRIASRHDKARTQQYDSTPGKDKYQHGGRRHGTPSK